MPRKTKESENKKETLTERLFPKKSSKAEDLKKIKEKSSKKTKSETDSLKKISTKKSENIKVESTPKTSSKSSNKKSSPSTSKEKVTSSKTSKKASTKTSKSTSSKSVSSSSKKSTRSKKVAQTFTPEYYDLPYKYNQTVVKILAQTPTNLFVYWEISQEDREKLKAQYGQYFFEITKPVLIVHNETMGYVFEQDIDDFANSWYLHVSDSNCQYKIELGRRPIPINYNYIPQYNLEKEGPIKPITTPYIYISSSNKITSPNDHILFNKQDKIYFRNIKTNQVIEKDIKSFPFVLKENYFVNIYELYKDLYKEEMLNNNFDILSNPTSSNPSSNSLSSKFK